MSSTNRSTASRPIRSGPEPKLSIVVVWSSGTDALDPVLESLLPQSIRHGAEIVVAHADHLDATRHRGKSLGIQFVEGRQDAGTGALRRGGFAAADGDIVAIIDVLAGPPAPTLLDQLLERGSLASRESNT